MRPSRKAASPADSGVGVVWWPELDTLCGPGEGLVHVLEVEPETFWVPQGAPNTDLRHRFLDCWAIGRSQSCCMVSVHRSVAA